MNKDDPRNLTKDNNLLGAPHHGLRKLNFENTQKEK